MKKLTQQYTSLKYLALIVFAFLSASCEEVIEIDLNSASPKLVAEGLIEKDSVAWIRLSYTTDYFATDQTTYAEDATVVLYDQSGRSEKLNYYGDGLYKGEILKGKVNEDYRISVEESGSTYQAATRLMAPSKIYSVSFEEQEAKRPGETTSNYELTINFSDDPETDNYYLIKFWINDTLYADNYIYLKDSYYTTDKVVEYSPFRIEFEQNDRVFVKLYSIDEDSYTYFNQLNDISGSEMGGSSTPYNPQSNFGSDVLGYFMATSHDSISVIVR
ncbi:DUF4249 domain-containing protein [Mangrovibacterium sp.]|uniref:DUF4249 domain-containing protein n=1 Tax=Mangrovibacterium sp. TaxID=1961364 RepID=UPI003561CEE1